MQDESFDDSMSPDLLSRYKPLAIRAVVAACSIRAEPARAGPGVPLRHAPQFHDVPNRDEPAIAFIR
ncbi:hypothetical protein [Shinella sp. BYT-45]|uniref:hypothetical protein n=1 Tax=Shinella sp. BYT-45 TaxID=3377377 RepID=UPI00397FB0F6